MGQDQAKFRPFTGTINMPLCKAHAEEATSQPHLVVTDNNWAALQFVMACNSPQKPDRSTLELFTIKGKAPRATAPQRATG